MRSPGKMMISEKKIGETLVREGLISPKQLEIALKEQKRTNTRLGDIVVDLKFADEFQIAPVLAKYFDILFVDIEKIYKDIKPDVLDTVPLELAIRFNAIPIEKNNNAITVAIADPLDLIAIDTLRIKTGCKIRCVVAIKSLITQAIQYCYHSLPRMDKHIKKFVDLEVQDIRPMIQNGGSEEFDADDQPVIQYVKSLIIKAVNSLASDIHLQPKEEYADLRFRIDGVLYNVDPPPKKMMPAIISRIKIIAGLDIAEKRLPQDGRFKVKVEDQEVDLRVSCFPTLYGENVVMRLLNISAPLLGLDLLGFEPQELEIYRRYIRRSYGLILVTGPTGSGKTTTLYATLNEIKTSEKNMITLEDPVEYRLPFIQQTQVNPQIGLTFACGLRSVVRQDPDIIMVGEIRDRETAEIAINAALTGHLVFSTLHTNDAAGAAARLIKMGVEPFLITSSLLCVIAQRLVRVICPLCKEIYNVDQEIIKKMNFNHGIKDFFSGKGCKKCFGTGYKGRQGLFEVLAVNEEIRKLILDKRSSEEIRLAGTKNGMKTLREAGMAALKKGLTSPEEILRVTQETEDS